METSELNKGQSYENHMKRTPSERKMFRKMKRWITYFQFVPILYIILFMLEFGFRVKGINATSVILIILFTYKAFLLLAASPVFGFCKHFNFLVIFSYFIFVWDKLMNIHDHTVEAVLSMICGIVLLFTIPYVKPNLERAFRDPKKDS
jgi:hypothetical protein